MKDVYVVLAFHAHELLWDLPEILLENLEDNNLMKDTFLDDNYIKKRKEESRDIYSLCSKFGDKLKAPLCVEYSNELLAQIKEVLPKTFKNLQKDYQRGRLYPLYGHAHHTHVSLLKPEEIIQEVQWNMHYLHGEMEVPYPKYKGLFPAEASLSYDKMEGIEQANIDYVIFPHLSKNKVPFEFQGDGDYQYKPFLLKTAQKNILAFPRNFPISQEIWRPITKMKRDEVKSQGYLLGKYPVFSEEYLYDHKEEYPIELKEGVELYKDVLRRELSNAPQNGVLVYIQDMELMDFGDIAIEIMEKSWKDILKEEQDNYKIHFVTPDEYIDRIVKDEGINNLPVLSFSKINWAPEIRLILRVDGHYPPLGVTGIGRYTRKNGLYDYPHIFWENGKYYCGIFDTLLDNFNIYQNVPVQASWLNNPEYELNRDNSQEVKIILYNRLMKRACNWGWRPTEGRQKLPCLKGYLICSILLEKMQNYPPELILNRNPQNINPKNIAGIVEILNTFIVGRVDYLKYGMEKLAKEKNMDLANVYSHLEETFYWKDMAVNNAKELYRVNESNINNVDKMYKTLLLVRDYSHAVFMATEYIQRIWSEVHDVEYLVEKMYEYLYDIYPPHFPSMLDGIDAMEKEDIEKYFAGKKELIRL